MLRTIGFNALHKCKASQAQVIQRRLVYGKSAERVLTYEVDNL
jgi:hypothetical protein